MLIQADSPLEAADPKPTEAHQPRRHPPPTALAPLQRAALLLLLLAQPLPRPRLLLASPRPVLQQQRVSQRPRPERVRALALVSELVLAQAQRRLQVVLLLEPLAFGVQELLGLGLARPMVQLEQPPADVCVEESEDVRTEDGIRVEGKWHTRVTNITPPSMSVCVSVCLPPQATLQVRATCPPSIPPAPLSPSFPARRCPQPIPSPNLSPYTLTQTPFFNLSLSHPPDPHSTPLHSPHPYSPRSPHLGGCRGFEPLSLGLGIGVLGFTPNPEPKGFRVWGFRV